MKSIDSTDVTVFEFFWKNRLGVFYPFVPRVLFTYIVLISRWVYSSLCWNFNFFIWHETETWTSDRSWKKEMIDDIVILVMYLRCNLRTRHGFEKKSHDQVDDFTNQRYQSRDIPSISFNFIPSQEVEKWQGVIFLHLKLGQ